jgi:hypothetical protein
MNRIRDYASGAELRSAYLEEARALGYEEDAPELIPVDIDNWSGVCHDAMDHAEETGHRVVVDSWNGAIYGPREAEGPGVDFEDECDGADRDGGFPVIPAGQIDAEVAADVHRLTHPEGGRP